MKSIDLRNLDKSDWQTYRFEEIAQTISERVDPTTTDLEHYIGLEHLDKESIHIKRMGTKDDVKGQKLKCYPGDVIFGKRRAYQRKASVVTVEAICSAHAFVLRANPEIIDPALFPFFLHSDQFMHRAVDISVGGLSPTINWKNLRSQEFLLPPKEQQAEFAELLWAMDEVIEKGLEVLKSINSVINANRRELKTGKLVPYTGNDLTSLITKGASPKWQGFDYCEEGTLFVTSENVLEDKIDLTEKKFLPISFHKKQKRSQLRKYDVLINIVGASIGRLAVFNEDVDSANINQAVCLFRVDTTMVNPEYIVNYLLENSNKTRLLNNQSATARPNLSLKNLSDFVFYLPTLKEQQIRLKRIRIIKNCKNSLLLKNRDSRSLQKSLINQVF